LTRRIIMARVITEDDDDDDDDRPSHPSIRVMA
jgi:hypothetical protein